MNQALKLNALILTLWMPLATYSHAGEGETSPPSIKGTVGVSYSVGKMKNDDLALVPRTMSAISADGLFGYSTGRWLLGLNFDYSWDAQLSELSNTNNTNLKGRGWVFGVGAKFEATSYLSLQAAFGFLGNYTFFQRGSGSQLTSLTGPLTGRLKAQFYTADHSPFSLDVDFRYISWATFNVDEISTSHTTSQWLAGLGVTYHFGRCKLPPQKVELTPNAPLEVVPVDRSSLHQQEISQEEVALAEITEVVKKENELVLIIEGEGFIRRKGLKAPGRVQVARIGQELAKHKNQMIGLEGSQKVVHQVKTILIENRVNPQRISVRELEESISPLKGKGKGKRKKQERSDETPRVEIHVDTTDTL